MGSGLLGLHRFLWIVFVQCNFVIISLIVVSRVPLLIAWICISVLKLVSYLDNVGVKCVICYSLLYHLILCIVTAFLNFGLLFVLGSREL